MNAKNLVACGTNHSILVTAAGRAYVWGSSEENELGLHSLRGASQKTPYEYSLVSGQDSFSAVAVACGEQHTALLVNDRKQQPLKLIFSEGVPISSYFSKIVNYILEKEKHNQEYRLHWCVGKKPSLCKKDLTGFFDSMSHECVGMPEEHIKQVVELLLRKGDGESVSYKEFRDQLHGTRMNKGKLMTWGKADQGRLGRAQLASEHAGEDLYHKIVDFGSYDVFIIKVACGRSHTLAITNDYKVWAWGLNGHGQLGDDSTKNRSAPVRVKLEADKVIDIAGGGYHSLALDSEGKVYAWGLGQSGRLGLGESNLEHVPKQLHEFALGCQQVAAGHSHSGCIAEGDVYT